MIRAVIFDWGGVLIENPTSAVIAYLAKALGVTEDALKNSYSKFAHELEKGMMSEDALWERLSNELEIKKSTPSSLWGEGFRHVYAPRKEMFSLASQLKKGGYRVGLISNTEIAAMKYFQEQQYGMFDAAVFSCAEGTRKPEGRIYKIALQRLGVLPNEAIFIDDRADYTAGAAKSGMNVILFKNPEQVKKELTSLSVHIGEDDKRRNRNERGRCRNSHSQRVFRTDRSDG